MILQPKDLNISIPIEFDMEQQEKLDAFQKPFDLGNESSNSSLVVSNLNQEAEFRKLFLESLTLREIARRYNTNYKRVQKLIGDDYYKLKKKCRYCDNIFYKKDYPNIFDKKIICDSNECIKNYNKEKRIERGKGYYRLKEKEWRLRNPNYQNKWRKNNPEKVKKLAKKWNKIYDPIAKIKKREKENNRRKELGLPLIGECYKKENELAKYIIDLFPNNNLLQRKRIIKVDNQDRRKNLELDIYIPELKLAFEYMGEQHYLEKKFNRITKYRKRINSKRKYRSFENLKYADRIKKKICKLMGVKLIRIKYNEKLSPELIVNTLKRSGINV